MRMLYVHDPRDLLAQVTSHPHFSPAQTLMYSLAAVVQTTTQQQT